MNTENPKRVIGSVTDSAIYKAAGEKLLLAERKKIGGTGSQYRCFRGYRHYVGVFYDWLREKNPKPYGGFGNGSAMRVSAAERLAYYSKKHTVLLRLTRKNKSHITTNAKNVLPIKSITSCF